MGAPRFETVADMGTVDTPKQRLAVTYLVASGLLQWFGIAEPAQLRPDGTPVADAYGTSRYYQVRQWGNDNGIDVELRPGDTS